MNFVFWWVRYQIIPRSDTILTPHSLFKLHMTSLDVGMMLMLMWVSWNETIVCGRSKQQHFRSADTSQQLINTHTSGWWAAGRTRGPRGLLVPSLGIKIIKKRTLCCLCCHSYLHWHMKQKWCLSSENNKPELFALITVFFPPSASITDKLTLFLLRYWLNLPFLFFPLLLLSSWAFCGDAPARRGEPTLGCDCAQELEDCITACGERPQEWTEMAEKDREGETERGRKEDVDSRWCILLVCVYGGAKVKSEVWAGCKRGAEEWRVRGHRGWGWWSGSAKTNTCLSPGGS